jgi:cell division protein FtsB
MWITEKLGLKQATPRKLMLAVGMLLLLWVLFLDSHSIFNRVSWNREADQLEVQNEELREEIQQIKHDIKHAGDPENVERVAREEYGMRRDGEKVYRVEEP